MRADMKVALVFAHVVVKETAESILDSLFGIIKREFNECGQSPCIVVDLSDEQLRCLKEEIDIMNAFLVGAYKNIQGDIFSIECPVPPLLS